MKNKLDSLFFIRLFVSERKQIVLMADEKPSSRISRRRFATSCSEKGISMYDIDRLAIAIVIVAALIICCVIIAIVNARRKRK